MRIRLDIDDGNVRQVLRQLREAVDDMTPAMKAVAGQLETSAKNRFLTKKAPDGSTWARLATATQRRRLKKGRRRNDKLVFSGALRDSIHSDFDSRSAVVGTDAPYGRTHQEGAERGEFGSFSIVRAGIAGRRQRLLGQAVKAGLTSRRRAGIPIPWGDIPARPFLGLSADDREDIVDIIRSHLTRAAE